jgi:5-methylcytosine-specific restriction protein A
MPFPKYKDIEIPLLLELARHPEGAGPVDLYDVVAKHFALTPEELSLSNASEPHRTKWETAVRFVRKDLKKNGELDGDDYGIWRITEKGLQRIMSQRGDIDEIVARDIQAQEIEHEYGEGRHSHVLTSRYERDPRARAAAVKLHGTTCVACGFSFEVFYGDHGAGFIQVHHIRSIASYGGTVEVDPTKDMTVLCSNCHSMIHRSPNNPLTVQQLKALIEEAGLRKTQA